jgi:hypothetical protein
MRRELQANQVSGFWYPPARKRSPDSWLVTAAVIRVSSGVMPMSVVRGGGRRDGARQAGGRGQPGAGRAARLCGCPDSCRAVLAVR